ncbi:glycosyltransferase family 4 protein [Calothrix sp. FACHB-156]|nr:glycosyltransferase family 4 protein [Calothrix sp. FACHB-156]
MNVLHINQTDVTGGAAIAAYRLHQGLLAQGVNSHLLVASQMQENERIAQIKRLPRIEYRLRYINEALGLRHLNFISSFNIPNAPFYQQANVLNFHNIHGGFFSYLALGQLTNQKPSVFTLHDMWSFTGQCTYSYDCERWKLGCGKCPYPDPTISRDSSHIELRLKNWIYKKSKLTIIAPSFWLAKQAKQSILGRFNIHHIPNGIDTDTYQPLEKEKCRDILGIPLNKKVLMFGAQSLKDQRKGGDLLLRALAALPKSLHSELILLTLGNEGEKIANIVGLPTFPLGYVSSDRLKSIAYSAADLFVFPTRADNLPLILQESMACGTPMVSFDVGGVPDLVRHKTTGYLAQSENQGDFCTGIVELLEDTQLRQQMSEQCRAIALAEYTLELQSKRYLEVYNSL